MKKKQVKTKDGNFKKGQVYKYKEKYGLYEIELILEYKESIRLVNNFNKPLDVFIFRVIEIINDNGYGVFCNPLIKIGDDYRITKNTEYEMTLITDFDSDLKELLDD
jgi:hypothetical protein